MPQNLSPTLSGVIRYPHCDRISAWARLKIGSLSTSTPSQSKMTRSGALFILCYNESSAKIAVVGWAEHGEAHYLAVTRHGLRFRSAHPTINLLRKKHERRTPKCNATQRFLV